MNYLLACSACNSRFKRQLHAVDALGAPLLIDPTVDDPFRHIHLVLNTGEYLGITDRGDCTIATVGLNEDKRPEARRQALSVMVLVIEKWWSATSSGNRAGVATAVSVLRDQPFAGVFQAMLRQAVREEADLFFEGIEDGVRLLELLRRPELRAGLSA
ncbi:HNH endonuclease [Kitasatospora purpeofusca]|uniref:HNH endonuclease n=1 Tax=Kitasatospora purpeofusca TaxID=67352 RepID=UPI0038045252